MEEIAEAAGSFNYEMMVGISRRVARYYMSGGEVVRMVHYILK
jgi:hypothetical protein